jgi:hypothetical protein
MGIPVETWVFIAIFVLAGFLVITCALQQAELSFALIVAGLITAGFSSFAVSKRFRKLIESI